MSKEWRLIASHEWGALTRCRGRSKITLVLAFLALTVLTGCTFVKVELSIAKAPAVAALEPIYELPTISLAEKEAILFDAIIERHLNEEGYLLYQSHLPLSDLENYQRSHNSADMPAWHGHWIAALAMKLAVAPSPDVESLLLRAVKGLRTNFVATGITGLLGRAYLKYAGDQPLHHFYPSGIVRGYR